MLKLTLVLIAFFGIGNLYSQPTIEDLDDPSPFVRSNALFLIQEMKLTEFTEVLEDRIFIQPEPFMIDAYLRTLKDLESPKLYDIANEFIDVADNFNNMEPPKDPLESKVLATQILFSFNNYNTIEFVFEILDRDRPKINAIAFSLLKEIIMNVPEYEQMAKSELLSIVNNIPATTNGPIDYYRYNAIITLYEFYNVEVIENVIELFENDPFMPNRSASLKILIDSNFQGLNQLLKERLLVDPDYPLRIAIADSLLTIFGEPSDLKSVVDYQPTEPNETARSLMAYSATHFIPPKPGGLGYYDLATSLISYTEEMFQYGWIADNETRTYYTTRLTDIIEYIEQTGKNDGACSIIEEALVKLGEDLSMDLITIEAYKFLLYYTIYIKEEIEEEFGPCP